VGQAPAGGPLSVMKPLMDMVRTCAIIYVGCRGLQCTRVYN
jgi:hypothetical protein